MITTLIKTFNKYLLSNIFSKILPEVQFLFTVNLLFSYDVNGLLPSTNFHTKFQKSRHSSSFETFTSLLN